MIKAITEQCSRNLIYTNATNVQEWTQHKSIFSKTNTSVLSASTEQC